MIKIGILGILGRMGQAIMRAIEENPHTDLAGGTYVSSDQHDLACFMTHSSDALAKVSDILIDFTAITATKKHIQSALDARIPIVIGTTGFSSEDEDFLMLASKSIPILQSGNMSLGVNLLTKLVAQTAKILDQNWDIEITEAHHRKKVDSPSGTALMLGKAAADSRNIDFTQNAKLSREGIEEPRPIGEIGFSTIRGGAIIGDHNVMFVHNDEILTLSHRAQDRKIFANGAVYAAQKLVSLPIGFYNMQDILPIK